MTWTKFWRWVAILYALSFGGFLVKGASELGGLGALNPWQGLALLVLPGIYMLPLGLVLFAYLAFKRFRIESAQGLVSTLGLIYIAVVVVRLLSSQPL